MKLLLLGPLYFCVLAVSAQVQPQSPPSSLESTVRLETARDWVTLLCISNDANDALNPASLRAKLLKWQQGQSDDACKPGKTDSLPIHSVSYIPNLRDRLLRVMQFRTEVQQTQSYVYGIPENSQPGTQAAFYSNPDHGILAYGGPLHLDELFVPSDTRVALCQAIPEDAGAARTKNHCDEVEYMLASRPRDKWARIGSAIALDVKVAQVPLYQNGIIIGNHSPSRAKWTPTITGSLDPSKLFRSLSESKELASFYAKSGPPKEFGPNNVCGESWMKPDEQARRCAMKYGSGSYAQKIALSLIPKIDVKVTTPFDLVKYGNTFLEPPNKSGKSLYLVTFNWDLRNAIPSASTRATSLKILTQVGKPAIPKGVAAPLEKNERQWRGTVALYFIELANNPNLSGDSAWWKDFEAVILHGGA